MWKWIGKCVGVISLQGHLFTFWIIEIYFKIFAQKYVESGGGMSCVPLPPSPTHTLLSCKFVFHYSVYLDLPSPVHLDCTVTLGAVVIVW